MDALELLDFLTPSASIEAKQQQQHKLHPAPESQNAPGAAETQTCKFHASATDSLSQDYILNPNHREH